MLSSGFISCSSGGIQIVKACPLHMPQLLIRRRTEAMTSQELDCLSQPVINVMDLHAQPQGQNNCCKWQMLCPPPPGLCIATGSKLMALANTRTAGPNKQSRSEHTTVDVFGVQALLGTGSLQLSHRCYCILRNCQRPTSMVTCCMIGQCC